MKWFKRQMNSKPYYSYKTDKDAHAEFHVESWGNRFYAQDLRELFRYDEKGDFRPSKMYFFGHVEEAKHVCEECFKNKTMIPDTYLDKEREERDERFTKLMEESRELLERLQNESRETGA